MRIIISALCLFLTLASCSQDKQQQVQWFADGDSVTKGGNVGRKPAGDGSSYPEQAQAILNSAGATHVELIQQGYPSKTYAWYLTDTRMFHGITPIQHTINQFDTAHFRRPIVTLFFAANDLTNQDSSRTSHTPAGVYAYLQQATHQLEQAGATVLVSLAMNRTDSYATPTFNPDRLELNRLILAGYPAANVIDLSTEPAVYSAEAPNNSAAFPDRVHPSAATDKLLGKAFARSIAGKLGISL